MLGEMALCAKKRPPGKTRGCRWARREWVDWPREQRQEGPLVEGLKEGGLEPLPDAEGPGRPTSSP